MMNKIINKLIVASIIIGCSLYGMQAKLHISNLSRSEQPTSVIILGGGVSGLAAASCFTENAVSCLVIQGPVPEGALSKARIVRNWPGKQGVAGSDIIDEMTNHVQINKIPILEEEVVDVDFSFWPYRIKTQRLDDGAIVERTALSCIIAMGSESNLLNIPGESGDDGYFGKGVCTCVWCDGPLYKNKKVIVIGSGQSAIFEATHLASIAREVLIVAREDRLAARDPHELDRLLARPNVKVVFNTDAKEIKGDGSAVTQLIVRNNKTSQESAIDVDGIFLAIGSRPKTSLFKNQVKLNERGAIELSMNQATSKEGVFAAGEVCASKFSSAIACAGQGCIAALQAKNFLEGVGLPFLAQKDWGYNTRSDLSVDYDYVASNELALNEYRGTTEIYTQDDFKKLVLDASLPLVIDFYSPACSSCKRMMPVFEELSKGYQGKVNFIKVSISNMDVAADSLVRRLRGNEIKSVPTFLLVSKGREISRVVGVLTRDQLKQKIDQTFRL